MGTPRSRSGRLPGGLGRTVANTRGGSGTAVATAPAHAGARLQPFAALPARFQQAGLTPDAFRSIEDLRRLPITTREDLRQPDTLLADNFNREGLRSSMTSGSTGRRTTSYFDEAAWSVPNIC